MDQPTSKRLCVDKSEYEANTKLLKIEMKKKKPKSKVVKKLMDATEEARRDWIQNDSPHV